MAEFGAAPTVDDLKRVQDELMREIDEDDDWGGHDHRRNGRWPMIHKIGDLIRAQSKEIQ